MASKKQTWTREYERKQVRLAQKGDKEAEARLLEQFRHMIYKMAIKVSRNYDVTDDAYQIGCEEFLQAIKRFNLRKKVRVTTYCYATMIPRMYRRVIMLQPIVRVPYYALQSTDGLRARRITSLDAAFHENSSFEHREQNNLHDVLSVDSDVHVALELEDDLESLRSAIDALDERKRAVIKARLEGRTLRDISEQLGVTKERIRQIEAQAKKELGIILRRKRKSA